MRPCWWTACLFALFGHAFGFRGLLDPGMHQALSDSVDAEDSTYDGIIDELFHDFFAQDICSNKTISAGASWCRFRNPYITPFLAQIGTNVTAHTNVSTIQCDQGDGESDLYTPCRSIVGSTSMQVLDTRKPYNTTSFESLRIVALAIVTGDVVITDFNKQNEDTSTILRFQATDGRPDFVDSVSNGRDGLILVGKANTITFWAAHPSWDVGVSRCAFKQYEGETIVGHEFGSWRDDVANKDEAGVLLLLLRNEETGAHRITFTRIAAGCGDSIEWDAHKWTIDESPQAQDMRVMSVRHPFNRTSSNSDESYHRMIVLSDAKVVMVYAWSPDLAPEQTIAFGAPSAGEPRPPALFYSADVAGGETITAATIGVEGMRRYISSSGSFELGDATGALLWLYVGQEWAAEPDGSQPAPTIRQLSLTEFAHTVATVPIEQLMTDPATRNANDPDKQWATCDFADWFSHDESKCIARIGNSLELPAPARFIQPRWRDVATAMLPFVSIFYCKTYCTPLINDHERYQQCQLTFGITCPPDPVDLLSSLNSDVIKLQPVMSQFLMTILVVQHDTSQVSLFGSQQLYSTPYDVTFRNLNTLDYLGKVLDVHMSPNAQHLFVSIERTKWQLVSIDRLRVICETLADDPDNAFLSEYQVACDESDEDERVIDTKQFAQYASLCPPGSYCPSLYREYISSVGQGSYTEKPSQVKDCTPGSFCPQGTKVDCPIGYTCPGVGNTMPVKCGSDDDMLLSCYGETLQAPTECSDGAACIASYYPGIPAPPGTYTEPGARVHDGKFLECASGDWCSLGRYVAPMDNVTDVQDLECPRGTVCPQPYVLEPTVCTRDDDYTSYCEAGSTEEHPCPAGYYCTRPWQKKKCSKSHYCPKGSVMYEVCPAGYYCPDPAEKRKCPAGYFCREGSVAASRCHLFSRCPEGTEDELHSYAGLFVDLLLLVGVWATVQVYVRIRERRRVKREAIRKQDMEQPLIDISDDGVSVIDNAAPALPPRELTIDIQFKDLGLKLKNGRPVLAGVTGELCHGEVTAVMGPSGAGKTTFLSTLSGKAYYGTTTGSIFINGEERDVTGFKKLMGFVPQDDIMLREMTVKEILRFSAATRLPASTSRAERHAIVDRVLDILGLREIRHSVIGDEEKRGISGGQRKRVNIGMELVADPTILFLDEPTSGLDSKSSKDVCLCLRSIAESGLTVATVLHQPSYTIFTSFHKVLLLGKGGRTVYLGPAEDAVHYFASIGFECPALQNPADFFMDVISGEVPCQGKPDFQPSDLFDLWETHRVAEAAEKAKRETAATAEADEEADEVASASAESTSGSKRKRLRAAMFGEQLSLRKTPSLFYLIAQVTWRALIQQTRSWTFVFLDNALVYIAGLALGAIYASMKYAGPPPEELSSLCPEALRSRCEQPMYDPIINQISLTVLALSLTTSMAALRVFGNERTVYWREASNGDRKWTLAYFVGKNLSQLIQIALFPVIFLSVYYTVTTPRASLLMYYWVLLLMTWTATGCAYFISIAVPPSLAQLASVVFCLICQMGAGTQPTLSQLSDMVFPLPLLPHVSFMRYVQEALYTKEIQTFSNVYDIQISLDLVSYDVDRYALDLWIVFGIGALARLLAFIAMLLLNRGKKK